MRPEHVTRTPTNGSSVLLSRVSVCIMWIVYCTALPLWREFWSRDTDVYLTYIRFDTVLCQFLETENQIDVLYVSFKTWDSLVLSYTLFHFSFTVSLMQQNKITRINIFSWKRIFFTNFCRLRNVPNLQYISKAVEHNSVCLE